jgi:hypothetical protein
MAGLRGPPGGLLKARRSSVMVHRCRAIAAQAGRRNAWSPLPPMVCRTRTHKKQFAKVTVTAAKIDRTHNQKLKNGKVEDMGTQTDTKGLTKKHGFAPIHRRRVHREGGGGKARPRRGCNTPSDAPDGRDDRVSAIALMPAGDSPQAVPR